MTYYNDVYVIFTLYSEDEELEWKHATEFLPCGAIPAIIVNFHTKTIFQIYNLCNKSELFDFIAAHFQRSINKYKLSLRDLRNYFVYIKS